MVHHVWYRFKLSEPSECRAFFSHPSRAETKWVLKVQDHMGKGVKHVPDPAAFDAMLRAPYSRCDGNFSRSAPPAVVQRDIEPHLHEGKKYDLREFILLRAPTARTPAAAYHLPLNGFARLCAEPYARRDEMPRDTNWARICNLANSIKHPRYAITKHKGPCIYDAPGGVPRGAILGRRFAQSNAWHIRRAPLWL